MSRLRGRESAIALALGATLLGATLANPAFARPVNLADMLASCAPALIIACGVALVIIAGEIDISVGSQYGFLAAFMGVLASPTHANLPVGASASLVLGAGLAVGLVNGALVAFARIPSIIVTLGMLTILRGATEVLLAGAWITDLPPGLRALGTDRFLGLAWSVWMAGACVLIGLWVALRTPVGRRLYALGSNPEAARLAGLHAPALRIGAFGATGALTGLAALVSVPQLPVIESGLGVGLELLVVTIVLVGGVSIRGGVGSLVGVALAAMLLGIVRTVLVFLKLGPGAASWERAIHGSFILGAVVIDRFSRGANRHAGALHEAVEGSPVLPHWAVLLVVTVGTLIAAGLSSPGFLAPSTQLALIPQAAELALLAVPMTLIMLTGGIDLSIGSAMALAAVVFGLAWDGGAPPWVAALLAVGTGTACGAFNGLCVTRARIHPLIVTLATLSLFRGLAEGISGGRPISGFPGTFTALATDRLAGVPVVMLPALGAFLGAGLLLWRGVAGRNIRAIGFNETACRLAGVAVDRLKLLLYTLAGAGAGLGALTLIARRNTAKADAGMGLELDVITAVVLGGTSVAGGRGSILGTLMGVLLLHELRQYIAWRWYHDELILLVVGAVLIASVPFGRLARTRPR